MRKIIAGTIAVIGVTVAISVADGSAHELLVRGIGIAMFITGAWIGKYFTQTQGYEKS